MLGSFILLLHIIIISTESFLLRPSHEYQFREGDKFPFTCKSDTPVTWKHIDYYKVTLERKNISKLVSLKRKHKGYFRCEGQIIDKQTQTHYYYYADGLLILISKM